MSIPGDNCPECDKRIRSDGTCICGWKPSTEPETPSRYRYSCADCREPTRIPQLTPGEDGKDRCASCHVAYLRERAKGVTDDTICTEPDCGKTVGDHRAEIRALLARFAKPWDRHPRDSEPGILERRGIHPWPRKALPEARTKP